MHSSRRCRQPPRLRRSDHLTGAATGPTTSIPSGPALTRSAADVRQPITMKAGVNAAARPPTPGAADGDAPGPISPPPSPKECSYTRAPGLDDRATAGRTEHRRVGDRQNGFASVDVGGDGFRRDRARTRASGSCVTSTVFATADRSETYARRRRIGAVRRFANEQVSLYFPSSNNRRSPRDSHSAAHALVPLNVTDTVGRLAACVSTNPGANDATSYATVVALTLVHEPNGSRRCARAVVDR